MKTIHANLTEGSWKRAVPFMLLFGYCLVIFQFVPEIWDDFYFGSLSAWGYTEPNVVGTDFTLSQLLHFASVLYQTRLPRIVSLVFLNAPLLRMQWLYRVFASLGITMVFYGIYHFSGARRNTLCAFLAVLLFGIFPQRMYTEGAFWYTAVMVTFVPNAFMFLVMFEFRKLERTSGAARVAGCCILAFFTCLLQEITAFTLCGTLALVILYRLVKERKIPIVQCAVLLTAVIGAALVCFGPGNLNRLEREAHPFLSYRIAGNLDGFITTVFHKSNIPFLLVFLFFICWLAYRQEPSSKNNLPCIAVFLWSASLVPLLLYYNSDSTLNLMPGNYNYTVRSVFFVTYCFLYLVYAIYLIAKQLIETNDWYLTAFGISALLSVISAFFYSSYIAHRMEITLYLFLFCIILRTFSELAGKIQRISTFSGVAAIACIWLSVFMIGYAKNAPILMRNRDILMNAGGGTVTGAEFSQVTLDISYDRYFTPEFVYPGEPGYPNQPDDIRSMREYYGLPMDKEIIFVYGDENENIISGTDSMESWAKRGPLSVITGEDGAAIMDWQANPILEWNATDTASIKYSELRGKEVTISLDVRSDDADLIDNMLYENGGGLLVDICVGSEPGVRQRWMFLNQISYPKLSTQWQHVSATLTLTDDAFTLVDDPNFIISDDSWVYISITNRSTYRMQVKHLKLELGSKATAWAPALEDM